LKNSPGGHSEEPDATKNPSFLWLFGQERFFASLRMTTNLPVRTGAIPFEAQGMLRFACLRRQAQNDNQRHFLNMLLGAQGHTQLYRVRFPLVGNRLARLAHALQMTVDRIASHCARLGEGAPVCH